MKIKYYKLGSLLVMGVLFTNHLLAQSTITELLKTKPIASTDKKNSNILSTYKHSFIKSYELTLANGAKVIVRADEGRKDVLMTAVCPGGASIADDNSFQSAMHAADIIGNSGLGDFSRADINHFFKQKGIMLIPQIDEKYSKLKGSFPAENLETILQAITLYFTAPKKDRTYFDTYIKGLTTRASIHSKNPYNVFQDSVNALLSTNKNRANILNEANIKKIDLDKAYDAFKKCLGNAHGFTFIFTGNFKVDEMNLPQQDVMNLFGQYLGSLPASKDSIGIIDRNTDIPQGKITRKIYNGHAPLAAVQLIYSGNYQHTDSVNLQLKELSYILEKNLDTLSAFKGANKALVKLTLNRFPKEIYAIDISFKCPSAQVDKMLATVHQTIAGLQKGIKSEDIKQYVAQRKKELRVQTFDYVFWRDYLALQVMNHDDIYEVVHYPYNFYHADEQTLTQAANQFLADSNYIRAILLPKKN